MGMADAALVLWTKFLRFDPQDPDWPNRDRFVLSAGHGSMLLYTMLHLVGLRRHARRPEVVPPVGEPDARAPGARPPARASRPRPARSARGSRNGVGMAIAAKMIAAALQPPRARRARDALRLRHRQRRRSDGGGVVGGGVAGRAPRPRQPRLPLRQQPDHDRGVDRPGVLRGRGEAVRRLRVAHPDRGRARQGRRRSGDRGRAARDGAARR